MRLFQIFAVLGAESLGVLVAILNLIWVPIVAFADIAIPDKILTLPIIAAFVVSLVHFVALYRLRVPTKWGQMLGAMVAAMSVQWTVSRAVGVHPSGYTPARAFCSPRKRPYRVTDVSGMNCHPSLRKGKPSTT
jgi:hypothetical protein